MITRKQYPQIMYRNSRSMHSMREGQKLARLVHSTNMPELSVEEVLKWADRMKFKPSWNFDSSAYKLGWILMYLKLSCQQIPEEIELEKCQRVDTFTNEKKEDLHMIGFKSMASTTAIGRLGRDPELNVTADGTPITRFSIAIDQYAGRDSEGNARNETLWLACNAWGKLAEQAEKFLTKGDMVYIEGQLKIRPYLDRESVQRVSTEVRLNTLIVLISGKNDAESVTARSNDDPFLPEYPPDSL